MRGNLVPLSGRALVLTSMLVLSGGLASCSRLLFAYVYNASDATIEVRYTARSATTEAGGVSCSLLDPPKLLMAKPHLPKRMDELRVAEKYVVDVASCAAIVQVPPGASLLVSMNGACANVAEKFKRVPGAQPPLVYMRIQGKSGVLERSGYAVLELFENYASGTCAAVYS